MNGRVCTWFSHTARPQKRHVPTAVRRQCQQSKRPPLSRRSLMVPCPVRRHILRVVRDEGVGHEATEATAIDAEGPYRGDGSNGCAPWSVEQQRNLADMLTRPDLTHATAGLHDLHLPGGDGEKVSTGAPLLHQHSPGRDLPPPSVSGERV